MTMNHPLQYKVVGIALVVEESGKGGRLLFRYPVKPEIANDNNNGPENIFYTLPSSVMAKLFRPKKALSGQPMTLSVGDTVFCCRETLVSSSRWIPQKASSLMPFSVIVALEKIADGPLGREVDNDADFDVVESSSILCIRRLHLSLARLCLAMEREERRCRYLSSQALSIVAIENEVKSKADKGNVVGGVSPIAENRRHRMMIASSSGTTSHPNTSNASTKGNCARKTDALRDRQEQDQEILDSMLACKLGESFQHGNLALELVQFFHAVASDGLSGVTTPPSVLSRHEASVAVNKHVSVGIEVIGGEDTEGNAQTVRPYHSLLFLGSSSIEISDMLPSSATTTQQLLTVSDPKRSIAECATDASLPLSTALEFAKILVAHGMCVTSIPLSKATVLACVEDAFLVMEKYAQDFSQRFPQMSMHCAASVLTNGLSLGELVNCLRSGTGATAEFLNDDAMMVFGRELWLSNEMKENSLDDVLDGMGSLEDRRNFQIERYVFSLAVWFRSRRIVVPQEEFMVFGKFIADRELDCCSSAEQGEYPDYAEPDVLRFSEALLENGVMGCVSTVAMRWRFGFDSRRLSRFRSWGLRQGRLRDVTRIPSKGDWGV